MKHSMISRLLVWSMAALALCGAPAQAEALADGQVSMTLEEFLEKSEEEWFLTGKKEYRVQAMMVSKETRFHNELEGTDYTVTDDGVTVLLKGTLGERWASQLSKVILTYTKTDGSELTEEDFAQKDIYINLLTKSQPNSYYARRVPVEISVTVETAWGDVLHTNLPSTNHGEGDYLVCRMDENDGPDLSDVWVVHGLLFTETYDLPDEPDPS
nr:hypothetical protein [uncultured bacterium]